MFRLPINNEIDDEFSGYQYQTDSISGKVFDAIISKNLEELKLVFKQNPNLSVDVKDNRGIFPLLYAMNLEFYDRNIVAFMLSKKPSILTSSKSGRTALQYALDMKNEEGFKQLLQYGFPIDVPYKAKTRYGVMTEGTIRDKIPIAWILCNPKTKVPESQFFFETSQRRTPSERSLVENLKEKYNNSKTFNDVKVVIEEAKKNSIPLSEIYSQNGLMGDVAFLPNKDFEYMSDLVEEGVEANPKVRNSSLLGYMVIENNREMIKFITDHKQYYVYVGTRNYSKTTLQKGLDYYKSLVPEEKREIFFLYD